MLDTDPNLSDVKNVIRSWLKDTAVHDPSVWVNITKRIMTGSSGNTSFSEPSRNIKKQRISNSNDREDDSDYEDEDADDFEEDNTDIPTSVADASGISANLSINVEIPPKWRTQLFALQCLQKTIDLITASGVREHFDLILARKRRQQAGIGDYLVFRIPDLIRLSFTAATAHVNELRLAGIGLLRMVIERFAATEDADLEGMLLLEQYAAQIGAALTPAFGADSSSEIVSAAVRVCAIYVGSGIVKDLYQLGRVLKLLTSALDKCKDETKITGVGDVKDLSPHASVMVKLSVLNAWAELQVASQKQDYLKQILQPNIGVLSPLWLRALQSYARIRLESDIVALSSSTGGIHASSNGGIESMYSAATKEVVLPYYRRSWLKIMEAVATLMETQALCMLDALASNSDASHANTKPSNLFYILFGLCIESLSRMSSSRSGKSNTSTMMICLGALKTFIHPTLAGQDFVPKTVFLELMNVFDRLIQTEECGVQFIIIEVIQRLIEFYGANYLCDDLKDSLEAESLDISLDPDVFPSTAKMYYILRVLINVFLQNVPSLSNKPTGVKPSKDSSTVLLSSLDALTKLVGITPASYKVDILAICFYVFSEILNSEKSQTLLAPRVLVSLKTMFYQFEYELSVKEKVSLSRVVCAMIHSLLDGLLSNKEVPVSVKRNKLLASVLILNGCPEASVNDGNGRTVLINTLKEALYFDVEEIVMTAHQCLRTFISISEKKASSKSSIMLGQAIINAVIPTVVTHTLNYKFSGENISKEDSTLSILEEDIKTLVMLPNTVPENQKKMILSVILPTLTAMLDTPPFDNTLSPIHTVTILHLLALATTMPQVFKSTVAELPEHVRAKLEASVRYSVVLSQQIQQEQKQQELQRKTTYTEDIKQPTIHLKTNFSNFS